MSNFITQFPFINFYTELLLISTLDWWHCSKKRTEQSQNQCGWESVMNQEFHGCFLVKILWLYIESFGVLGKQIWSQGLNMDSGKDIFQRKKSPVYDFLRDLCLLYNIQFSLKTSHFLAKLPLAPHMKCNSIWSAVVDN